MNVLIVEDEPYAQTELKRLLSKVPVPCTISTFIGVESMEL
jgi:hypothetical protein